LDGLRAQDSDTVPARAVGSGQFKPIEDAPGSYVKIRS
jgi:polyhydroxyalkanoate synthase subunit PhaC